MAFPDALGSWAKIFYGVSSNNGCISGRLSDANFGMVLSAWEIHVDKRVGDGAAIVVGITGIIMDQNTPKLDYLGPDIAEIAKLRGGGRIASAIKSGVAQNQLTRSLARRLLPACAIVPTLLWGALIFGVHRRWYHPETCLKLFVVAITVAFGLIVWLSLKKFSQADTDRSQALEQLKLAKDAAENANRFKSAFFANISHEIRTPLTAINGFAELLLNSDRTDKERLADARVIRRNGEHLLTLINDILDQSKIEAGKMSVEPILCSPAVVVGEVCSMLRPRASEKGLALAVKFEGSIPKTIRTDPTRLRQVLINLIANAIKFTKEGCVRLTVSIKPSIADAKPFLELKISDTGIGIPADRVDSLFRPFVQGDASISRQYGGSGLGLSISQYFARALGGDISVSSEVGRGSTFTVTIETGTLAGVAIEQRPDEALNAHDDFSGPKVRINGSVLVAEDGIDNQALIAIKLRETGLKVEIASNGQIACEKVFAAANPFDVILMDVQMPVMDGFAATQQLRGKGYRGPIIALTANATERDRSKCLNAGCNDFVTKPIKMESLLKAIGRYLKVVAVQKESAVTEGAGTTSREVLAQKFYKDLHAEIEKMEQAIEREDRVQLREAAQLLLGQSAAAGLKEVAAPAARLLHLAESEQSWDALRDAVSEFARNCQPEVALQAA
jgi:signal transduction histidine kinase/CheY-like chemotaxis protein